MDATVLPVATRALVDACGRLGLDTTVVLDRAGLTRRALDDPDARIPAEAADALWREARAATGDPALALHAAEATPFGAFRVLDYLGASGATLGEGLARVATYMPLIDPRASVQVVQEPGAVALTLQRRVGPVPASAQEYTLAILVSRIRHTAREPLAPSVRFTFARPAWAGEYPRVLGTEPTFEASAPAVVVQRQAWNGPTRSGSSQLFAALDLHARTLLAQAKADDVVGRVCAAIAASEPGTAPSLAGAARHLGVSTRTLQRQLKERGTEFSALVDEVRRARAEAFLAARDVSIAEVSWLLGFREQSAFARAFKRWTGRSPTRWRR